MIREREECMDMGLGTVQLLGCFAARYQLIQGQVTGMAKALVTWVKVTWVIVGLFLVSHCINPDH